MFASSFERTVEWGECDPADIVFYRNISACSTQRPPGCSRPHRAFRAHASSRNTRRSDGRSSTAKAVFHATTSYDDRVRIDSRILGLGRSSFQIEHLLFRGGTLCVEVVETRVWATREPPRAASHRVPFRTICAVVWRRNRRTGLHTMLENDWALSADWSEIDRVGTVFFPHYAGNGRSSDGPSSGKGLGIVWDAAAGRVWRDRMARGPDQNDVARTGER